MHYRCQSRTQQHEWKCQECEGAVIGITEAVVKQFTSNQMNKDEEYERGFNTLCEQLEIVVQIIKNQSVSAPPVQNSSLPQLQRRQVIGNNVRGQ